MKSALVIDYKYCDGCNSCVVACRMEKGLPVDEWGIKLKEIGPEKIDGKWMWNFLPYLSDRCDLCEERVAAGEKPSCVKHCLSSCLELVPYEELGQKLGQMGKTVAVMVP